MSSTAIINQAIDSVMDLIDAMGLFSTTTRGALGTGNGISCGIGPSGPDEVYFDKHQSITLDFTINGKHTDLQTLTDDLNKIHENLTMRTTYPDGNGWQIMDIQTVTLPQTIGREDNNAWIMASSLSIKVVTYTRNGYTPPIPPVQDDPDEPEEPVDPGEPDDSEDDTEQE